MTTKRQRGPRVESAEVLYAAEGLVTLDADGVAQLKRDAARIPRHRIRLCAHASLDDRLHEMLIVHERGCYVRPHKHVGKSESFHVIEGEVDVVIFDDAGGVADVIPMGTYASGRPFFYRLAEPTFHTLLIRSPVLVFHETTNGPFRREETLFAPWAPDDSQSDDVRRFLSGLNDVVASHLRQRGAGA
jgi:cupin fold WbuC family metalloprotein